MMHSSLRRKKEVTDDSYFEAHHQDPCWFLTIDIHDLPPYVDKLSLLKHKGDYFYFKNNYPSAISCYEEMLAILPDNNVVTRRECYDNLARCFIKDLKPGKSMYYSHLLHTTSRTVEHLTVSLTCLVDTHTACTAYPGAVLACAKLIAIHKLNSHLWLRLAHILSCVVSVELPGIGSLVHNQPQLEARCCDDVMCGAGMPGSFLSNWEGCKKNVLVLFCLMMSKYIMTGVRGTSVGFTAAVLSDNIHKIDDEISHLAAASALSTTLVSRLDCIVTKNVFGYEKNQDHGSEERSNFIDRGSSKFKGEVLEIGFSTVNSYSFEDFHREWFDDVLSIL